jgi:hypothetical protein
MTLHIKKIPENLYQEKPALLVFLSQCFEDMKLAVVRTSGGACGAKVVWRKIKKKYVLLDMLQFWLDISTKTQGLNPGGNGSPRRRENLRYLVFFYCIILHKPDNVDIRHSATFGFRGSIWP